MLTADDLAEAFYWPREREAHDMDYQVIGITLPRFCPPAAGAQPPGGQAARLLADCRAPVGHP